ncbi:MAG TPA: hypothetical protein VKX17_03750 [Planctomycetota bacterium]|nr:hypothetical protein [Planctomycetota bacterium]
MRAIVFSFLIVFIAALAWAVQAPLSAYWNVRAFSSERGDALAAEEALIRAGPAALPVLTRGLHSDNGNAQFHCAKVLMVLGDNEGEEFLLQALHAHPDKDDPIGREAEAFLLSAWDRRDGPDAMLRQKLSEAEAQDSAPQKLAVLNDCLARYPGWADGYARRARIYQQASEVYEARRDALAALSLAPNHFEALVTLGRIQLIADAPQLAYKCFERALTVNPRLKDALQNDIRDTFKALELERIRRREERRRNVPLV